MYEYHYSLYVDSSIKWMELFNGTVDDNPIDFWNIIRIGETCSGGKCEVRAEIRKEVHSSNTMSSAGASETVFLCSQCERKVCMCDMPIRGLNIGRK